MQPQGTFGLARHMAWVTSALLVITLASVASVDASAQTSPVNWSQPQLVEPPLGGLTALSCFDPSTCAAGDEHGGLFVSTGHGWASAGQLSTAAISSVSCGALHFCMTLDSSGVAHTVIGGTVGPAVEVFSSAPGVSVSCVSATWCLAVSGAETSSVWNGQSWSAPITLGDDSAPTSVSCTTAQMCMVVDAAGDGQQWNGEAWSPPTHIDTNPVLGLVSVSCPSAGLCVAVSGDGYGYTFDGVTWSQGVRFERPAGHVTDVACTISGFGPWCIATDDAGLGTSYSATSWAVAQFHISTSPVYAVTCEPGTRWDCLAAANDSQGTVVHYGGTSVEAVDNVDPVVSLTSVGCGPSECAAGDTQGRVISTVGAGVTAVRDDDLTGDAIVSVSCPTDLVCAGATQSGEIVFGSQQTTVVTSDPNALTAVSCATTTSCVAVDNSGDALQISDGHVSRSLVDPHRSLASVSCPTSTWCVAVDSAGDAVIDHGGVWSAPIRVDPSSTDGLVSVSCASVVFCVAVDGDGFASIMHSGVFSAPAFVDPRGGLDSISCPAVSHCLGADDNGGTVELSGTHWQDSGSPDLDAQAPVEVACTKNFTCDLVSPDNESETTL